MKAFAWLFVASCPLWASAQQPTFPLPPAEWPKPVHDTPAIPFVLLDRLEWREGRDASSILWDVQGWWGGDNHKLWLKAEGEKERGGRTEESSIDVLYARRLTPFWFLQAGARTEERPGPRRTGAVIGIQGLAPYWFDVEADALIRSNGAVQLRLEGESDIFLGQRLILQPRAELRAASKRDPEREFGRGFTNAEVGVRLRYEIRREFAPYIGVSWTRALGETADFARASGRRVSEPAAVIGVRIWY